MQIFNIYENIIKEDEINTNSQSCITQFGRELFGDQLGGNERNTRIEDRYAEMIKDFTDNQFGDAISSKLIKSLKNLQSCISTYPEVLHPEGIVYRGTNIPFKYLFMNYQNIDNDGNFQYIYKAKSMVQSWTENKTTGMQYAFGYKLMHMSGQLRNIMNKLSNSDYDTISDDDKMTWLLHEINMNNFLSDRIGVLLQHTATPDSFLFKGKYFNQLSKFSGENEILRIGKSPLNCWAHIPPMVVKLLNELNRLKKPLGITSDDFKV